MDTKKHAWLWLHQKKLFALILMLCGVLGINIHLGVLKVTSEIDWWDVFGEGGSAIAVGLWMTFILLSRPMGKVTDLLWCGLACLFVALFQDFLDEFFKNPLPQHWNGWIESGFMPIGIFTLSLGLYHWHKEQQAINQQLKKREGKIRQYQNIDQLTQLSQADYIQQVLDTNQADKRHKSQAIIMLDICDFNRFNRRYGFVQGDKLLQDVTDALLLCIPQDSTLCRYAADRFAVVLPNCHAPAAHKVAQQLREMIQHCCFRYCDETSQDDCLYIDLSYGLAVGDAHQKDNLGNLIDQANHTLRSKQYMTFA